MEKKFNVRIKLPISFVFNIKAESQSKLFVKIKSLLKDVVDIKADIIIDEGYKKLTAGTSYTGHTIYKSLHEFDSVICIKEIK